MAKSGENSVNNPSCTYPYPDRPTHASPGGGTQTTVTYSYLQFGRVLFACLLLWVLLLLWLLLLLLLLPNVGTP